MIYCPCIVLFFFFNDPTTTEIYTLSLHDALPISHEATRERAKRKGFDVDAPYLVVAADEIRRSEEHTSELQSPYDLVCRLLLEKKKKTRVKAPKSVNKPQHKRKHIVTKKLETIK